MALPLLYTKGRNPSPLPLLYCSSSPSLARKNSPTQKEAKYYPENWIDEGRLAIEFPTIRDMLH
ncbi:hypothetical protein HAX54_047268, partial [Datura stramonium]|nr:hypothetical protein [Datura stramonium]